MKRHRAISGQQRENWRGIQPIRLEFSLLLLLLLFSGKPDEEGGARRRGKRVVNSTSKEETVGGEEESFEPISIQHWLKYPSVQRLHHWIITIIIIYIHLLQDIKKSRLKLLKFNYLMIYLLNFYYLFIILKIKTLTIKIKLFNVTFIIFLLFIYNIKNNLIEINYLRYCIASVLYKFFYNCPY